MTDFVVLTVCCMLLGAVLFCCALLASTGVLTRNRWIGIRLGSTLASDAAWRAGHRAALRWGIVAVVDDVCCVAVGSVLLLVDDGVRRAIWGPRIAFTTNAVTVFPYVFSAYRAARGAGADQKHDGATKAKPGS